MTAVRPFVVGGTPTVNYVPVVQADGSIAWAAGGGGAPTTADYLVGTANGSLSAEIVVGTTPGGELGGTWASPTVDSVHSGSSHAAVQAAAEATAAGALSTHAALGATAHGGDAAKPGDVASDLGYLAWTWDPVMLQGWAAPSAGIIYLSRIKVAGTITPSKLCLIEGITGASCVNSYAALFDANGVQLGVSAEIGTSLNSTGIKQLAMTGAGLTNIPAGYVYGAILVGGFGTVPQFARSVATTAALMNGLLGAGAYRHAFYGSGQTSMPASLTMASMTIHGTPIWMGLAA